MGGRLGSLWNERVHGLDLLPGGSGCWAERGVIMGQANRAEPTPRSTFQRVLIGRGLGSVLPRLVCAVLSVYLLAPSRALCRMQVPWCVVL